MNYSVTSIWNTVEHLWLQGIWPVKTRLPFPLSSSSMGQGPASGARVEVLSGGWWNVLSRRAVLNLFQSFFFLFCWLTVRSWEDGQEGNDTSRGILCCATFCGSDARIYGLFTRSFASRLHGSNLIQQHMACCSKELWPSHPFMANYRSR